MFSTVYRITQKIFMHVRTCPCATYNSDNDDLEIITPHMLINTWQELEYRLDICRATTGAHIEVYGCAYKKFFGLFCTLLKT